MTRWRFPLLVWFLSRAFFLEVGAIGAHYVTPATPAAEREPPGVLGYWAHWDGAWYSSIATHGYHGTRWPSSTAFFPVYPGLVKFGTWVGGGAALWGVLISLTASLAAIWFFHE